MEKTKRKWKLVGEGQRGPKANHRINRVDSSREEDGLTTTAQRQIVRLV